MFNLCICNFILQKLQISVLIPRIRWQSGILNTKGSRLPVCDQFIQKQKEGQKVEEIEHSVMVYCSYLCQLHSSSSPEHSWTTWWRGSWNGNLGNWHCSVALHPANTYHTSNTCIIKKLFYKCKYYCKNKLSLKINHQAFNLVVENKATMTVQHYCHICVTAG